MRKEVKIDVGDILEVVPTFGARVYITSSGRIFDSLDKALDDEKYFRGNPYESIELVKKFPPTKNMFPSYPPSHWELL